MVQTHKVVVYVDPRKEIGDEVAYEVLTRANPHAEALIDKHLEDAGITVDVLSEYFIQVATAVAAFWANCDDPSKEMPLKPHELRGLYLPLIYGVILASVGNMEYGNYRYVLNPNPDRTVDKKFILETSAKLESLRRYVKGDTGQVGNRSAKPQVSTMLAIMGEVDCGSHSAQMLIRDGASYDSALSGFAVLCGLTLVQNAYTILYTGVEMVNFRTLVGTIRESGQRELNM